MGTVHAVPTPAGAARAHLDLPVGPPSALLVLGHGAGGGVTAPDLLAVTAAVAAAGLAVARVEQPYRVLGRRAPAPAGRLDVAWTAVVGALRVDIGAALPLVVGGRSSGARVACRTAATLRAAAVLALAFPVRPPGRDVDRLAELALPAVPVLVVQGARDRFGVPPPAPGRTVHLLPDAGHELRGQAGAAAAAVVVGWLARLGLTSRPN